MMAVPEPYEFSRDPWRFSAYAYEEAFRKVAEESPLSASQSLTLFMPLAFLCRHSIELSLKLAIQIMENGFHDEVDLNTHSLVYLWSKFGAVLDAAGVPIERDRFAERESLLISIHNVDPRGESFRYPSNKNGKIKWANISLRELSSAHDLITSYCYEMTSAYWDLANDLGNRDL